MSCASLLTHCFLTYGTPFQSEIFIKMHSILTLSSMISNTTHKTCFKNLVVVAISMKLMRKVRIIQSKLRVLLFIVLWRNSCLHQ